MQAVVALITGIVQVFLVALQTRQLAIGVQLWQIFVVGFGISAVWVLNVRAATGDWLTGLTYALGAGIGTCLATKVRLTQRRTDATSGPTTGADRPGDREAAERLDR
jgi:hypothetical protein